MSSQERSKITPAMLAKLKLTLSDLGDSNYDHETQTRKFEEGEAPPLVPDTQFDGESS